MQDLTNLKPNKNYFCINLLRIVKTQEVIINVDTTTSNEEKVIGIKNS